MSFFGLRAFWPWIAAAIYGAALFAHGYNQRLEGAAEAKAKGDVAISELRLEHTESDTKRARQAEADAKELAKKLTEEQTRADGLASSLAEQQRLHRKTTDHLSGEIARVNDLYREALDEPPKPVPACVFTNGWVRVYNEATGSAGAAMPKTANTGRAAAPPASTTAVEQLRSGVNQTQLLAHHVRYAEQCRNTATQLDLLIDQVTGK
jgi:predicted RNase H-like nuclease (RuvC/YqgF family)